MAGVAVSEMSGSGVNEHVGYGEEIVRVYKRAHSEVKKENKKLSWAEDLYQRVSDFLLPSTHPTDKQRICNALEKMKTEHAKMYPKLKKSMAIIYADLKC